MTLLLSGSVGSAGQYGFRPSAWSSKKPAFPEIGRDCRDGRLLLIARPVIEEALDPRAVRPREREVVGLHRIKTLSRLHPAAHAITRVRRAKLRGGRIVGRRDRRNDARGVVRISARHLMEGPGSARDAGLGKALRHIGNRNRRVGVGVDVDVRQEGGAGRRGKQ